MNGAFSERWLSLREPADRRARDPGLLARLEGLCEALSVRHAVDLGCGTGSTWRAMPQGLAHGLHWTMVDGDPHLLAEAARRIGPSANADYRTLDLADVAGIPLPYEGLVTASALFDLCSAAWINAFVPRIAESRAVLYAALTHDGRVTFTPAHGRDACIETAFRRHQQTDKGLGQALGADAAGHLAARLRDAGLHVVEAPSDWLLAQADGPLQLAYLDGYAAALGDDPVSVQGDLAPWLSFRRAAVDGAGAGCMVGHRDILAWPQG